MADLTITAADVRSFGTTKGGIAGGTITAGMPLYLNSSGQLVAAADTSATLAAVVGIALHAASANQPIEYHVSGLIDLGATLSIGKIYVLSAAGAIAPVDDVAMNDYVTVLGVATAADRLRLTINASGVQAASAVT